MDTESELMQALFILARLSQSLQGNGYVGVHKDRKAYH